jgi:tRNA1Val (adenine37-N6)-methyltransferase
VSKTEFRFKRFVVEQAGCAMKVGTDGVLLGAWCRVRPQDKLLLDIGTGTGVIALQLAQRTEMQNSFVEAVEIDEANCARARENFDRSEWTDRIRLHHSSIQDFVVATTDTTLANHFDHIVSNPPYFTRSLASPDKARTLARHTASLGHGELIEACDRLLAPDGRISLILPVIEAENLLKIAQDTGFWLSRRTEVWPTPRSGAKRLLIELSRAQIQAQTQAPPPPELSTLVIEDAEAGTLSPEYRTLTRDFYL